jgi:pyruvate kinase
LSKKGVNLPDTNVSQPSLTEKDLEDLAFILRQPSVNWIALSFVRRASDITELREHIRRAQHGAKIIAKIEKPEAIAVIDSIIAEADAIMVARGDLGVEMPIAELPLMQKDIVNRCVLAAKPVIVATQMMESMMENPSPTRPEVTDVANAMLDGCDAVMLSGETASGKHPILVVETMKRIIKTVEEKGNIYAKQHTPNSASRTYISDVVCYTACRTAADLKATTIIGMTKSGYTAFLVSSFRPNTDICIFSDNRHILNTLNLVWGVRSFFYDRFTTTDETIADVITILKKENIVKKGNIVINTGSMPLEARLRTNMLKVTEV